MSNEYVVITGAARTPMGAFQGSLSSVPATELGGVAIAAALHQAKLDKNLVDEVLMGNCLMAGEGQAPARQAAFAGGLPHACGATTLSKMCGSGMKAIMLAHDMLKAKSVDFMIAGGMESMSRAPYLLPRTGFRIGHGTVLDHMMYDGLEDAYEKGRSMGTFGEECAAKYGFTREMQDAYAIESIKRAQAAIQTKAFEAEIAKVAIKSKTGESWVDTDESPLKAKIEKIPTLKPAFAKDGTITAASSSSINDGASAVVLMRESSALENNMAIVAKILGTAQYAHEPKWFSTAPIYAAQKLLKQLGWGVNDVDLWEVNEAFAVVPMALMKELNVPHAKVNVNGGACALGHPIGSSGARIVVTLINTLKARGLKRGVATLCIGGGEATAIAIEVD